jgi:glucuronoarabinoxylan endo-1,4-beta-xylanase
MKKNKVFNIWLLSPFLLMIFITNSYAQTIDVTGTISTSTAPVQNASVTFIDNSDTTRQFSALTNSSGQYSIRITTSVSQHDNQPKDFTLEQNYPNPFSSSTVISYKLDTASDALITIYDILGREVRKISTGSKPSGVHQVVWDGLNNSGERVSAGIYFYRLQEGGKTQVRKMILGTDTNNSVVPLPQKLSSQHSVMTKGLKVMLQSEFTVRIANTATTFPTIVPKQIDNVTVQNNATLDFTVDEYVIPNAATIYLDSTMQIIRGFGAANILRWRPDMTTDQIDKAFGTDEGQVGLTILRLRIPPDANSFRDNVPTAQEAYWLGAKIIASPWSPPASMKTNNNAIGGRLREDAYADYAEHLKSFADYMADNDAPLYAISIQNEPDASVNYESCFWNATQILNFMKNNAASIGTRVMIPESQNFDHSLSDPTLNDPATAANVSIIAGHLYGGGIRSYPLAESKGKEVWMTEHLDTDTTWTHVLATGKEINDCMNAGMSAYIWWYIVRYYGPIGEDGKVTKRGYVMSQFARFIRPGYFRVFATRMPQSRVYVTAYRDDSRVVIVAINYRSQPIEQTFVLKDGEVGSFTPYITSPTENCVRQSEIPTSNHTFSATLAASSITTLVSE